MRFSSVLLTFSFSYINLDFGDPDLFLASSLNSILNAFCMNEEEEREERLKRLSFSSQCDLVLKIIPSALRWIWWYEGKKKWGKKNRKPILVFPSSFSSPCSNCPSETLFSNLTLAVSWRASCIRSASACFFLCVREREERLSFAQRWSLLFPSFLRDVSSGAREAREATRNDANGKKCVAEKREGVITLPLFFFPAFRWDWACGCTGVRCIYTTWRSTSSRCCWS